MGKQNGKRYHFLYRTTNLVNNNFYVGVHSTYNLSDGYLGSGKRLKRAIKKYGIENFKCEILEFFECREEVLKREKEVVNEQFLNDPHCMNLKPGGSGGLSSKEHLEKLKKGASNFIKAYNKKYFNRIKNDPILRKKRADLNSKIAKQNHIDGKFGFGFKGKKHTEKTKKILSKKSSLNQKGYKNSQFKTCWITNSLENKKIKKDDLKKYLQHGWTKGRKHHNEKILIFRNCKKCNKEFIIKSKTQNFCSKSCASSLRH